MARQSHEFCQCSTFEADLPFVGVSHQRFVRDWYGSAIGSEYTPCRKSLTPTSISSAFGAQSCRRTVHWAGEIGLGERNYEFSARSIVSSALSMSLRAEPKVSSTK